ncbi:hypothetical protein NM688_g1748 [Phlebia brevispora]|uniref:Uncharacterized protein n=1 Tax=Phlebia brevispora TaxID=194682 RepID=A0ACC1TAX8_9APHY|nr:hypothetical protein NM688_g1748 [Phlebia brevispora]
MVSLFPAAGPSLPSFKSLLIKGRYHASAPIHLCLSEALRPECTKVILVVASRAALTASLTHLRDEWIKVHGGEGRIAGAAMKVEVLYPPTPAHLNLLLSLFHESLSGEEDLLHEKTTFPTTPSLLVLCDLASYFLDIEEATVSSYLVLLTRALTSVSALSEQSGKCTSLAVFDSSLDALRLPLVRPVSPGHMQEGDGSSSPIGRVESLGFLAQRYFEWVGTVEEEPYDEEDEVLAETDVKRVCTLHMQRLVAFDSSSDPRLLHERLMEFFNDVGGDPLKPSLFELVAQEQLRDLLQPALKYVLSVFAQSYPRYLLRLVNRHEEFYAVLMFFVERHYLRTQGASFAENFYGLKRRRRPVFETDRAKTAVGGILPEEKLRGREIWRSLVFLVGLPYLRAKAQDYYEALGGGLDQDVIDGGADARQQRALSEPTLAAKLRRLFKAVYPWANTLFEVWLLACNIAYLFDKTPFYRPWLAWIGVDLRRMGVDDMRAARLAAQRKSTPNLPQDLAAKLRRLIFSSPRLLLDSLKVLLPTAIFFVKFLEWWYSPSSPSASEYRIHSIQKATRNNNDDNLCCYS